jgi:hypothetical protein
MFGQNLSRREFLKLSGLSSLYFVALGKNLKVNNNIFNHLDDDEKICKEKFKTFIENGLQEKPISDVIAGVGKSFLGTEYIANTLEINPKNEQLVVNFEGFDCVTFVENCLTFSRCLKSSNTTYQGFKNELEYIRYRDGSLDGYTSRLHYFCDWIYDNSKKGLVKDITRDLGGVLYDKTIDFMSTHAKLYKQLADKANLDNIKGIEDSINSRIHYYIPKEKISNIYDSLNTGDIIATTTTIDGLDVTHTGYIYKGEDGGTYFMHASSKYKKVIISGNQLSDYIDEDSKKNGIMVARPVEV